jgi:hypothetical protein
MERGALIVQTSPRPGCETEFDHWYDTVHAPEILATPGIVRARRLRVLTSPRWPARPEGEWHPNIAVYDFAADSVADSYATLLERMRSGDLSRADVIDPAAPYRSQIFRQILDLEA